MVKRYHYRHKLPFTVESNKMAVVALDYDRVTLQPIEDCKPGEWHVEVVYTPLNVDTTSIMLWHSSITPEAAMEMQTVLHPYIHFEEFTVLVVCDAKHFRDDSCVEADQDYDHPGETWRHYCMNAAANHQTLSQIIPFGVAAEVDNCLECWQGKDENGEIVMLNLKISEHSPDEIMVPYFYKDQLLQRLEPILEGTGISVIDFMLNGQDDDDCGYMKLSVPYQDKELDIAVTGTTEDAILLDIFSNIKMECNGKIPLLDSKWLEARPGLRLKIPPEYMTSNRNLGVGYMVTEIRFDPYIDDYLDGHWNHRAQVFHFKILEVYRNEYKCQYTDAEDSRVFYWPFWDKQPNYGFMENGSTPVRYY